MEEKDQVAGEEEFGLSSDEIDTIGEILNISMGSAATAMSALLDRQVVITPPKVALQLLESLDYTELEPAILVKIQYIEGLTGSNIMLFRQHDMQIILNLLMGTDDEPSDDFEFDELSMSAACEVMNQMMGASATALSEVLGKTVNISTPDAYVVKDNLADEFVSVGKDEKVVAISFGMMINDVMTTSFASIMPCTLAQMLINQVMGDQQKAVESIPTAAPKPSSPAPAAAPPPPPAASPVPAAPPPAPVAPAPAPMPPAAAPVPSAPPVQQQPAAAVPPAYVPPAAPAQTPGMPMGQQPPGYPPYPYPPQMYPQQPFYYPPQAPGAPDGAGGYSEMGVIKQPINVQAAQFPTFAPQAGAAYPGTGSNMDLLMNVPLDVTVEIGKTKRKIKDIMDFGQGTVIELEKQAGAPVDIVVNGQLIARGDVVVIEDNFGVRITEVLGTKDLVDSLSGDK